MALPLRVIRAVSLRGKKTEEEEREGRREDRRKNRQREPVVIDGVEVRPGTTTEELAKTPVPHRYPLYSNDIEANTVIIITSGFTQKDAI